MDSLRIGPIEVWPPVVLAPMAGVTNVAFRRLCRQYGDGLFVSEMVGARSLIEGQEKAELKAAFGPEESPRSIQLYGVDPDHVAEAVGILTDQERVDHIDLNFGCPAPKVTRHGGGAALPWHRSRFADVVRAAVESADGAVPVTVKMRLGIDDDHLTFIEAGKTAQDLGVAAVALHARTAAQRYGGQADWSRITELVHALDVPVLGNGDIWEAEDALRMVEQTGCAAVVVGRGCLGRPWLFRDLQAAFDGREVPAGPTLGEVGDMMVEHARLLAEFKGEGVGVREFRKHPTWYVQGFPVGRPTRKALGLVDTVADVEEIVAGFDRWRTFPEHVRRTPRGHTTPRRKVALPHGWLESREPLIPADRRAALAVSGG